MKPIIILCEWVILLNLWYGKPLYKGKKTMPLLYCLFGGSHKYKHFAFPSPLLLRHLGGVIMTLMSKIKSDLTVTDMLCFFLHRWRLWNREIRLRCYFVVCSKKTRDQGSGKGLPTLTSCVRSIVMSKNFLIRLMIGWLIMRFHCV